MSVPQTVYITVFLAWGQRSNLFLYIAGARVEDYVFEKLDKKSPARPTNSFLLGQTLTYAGRELNPGSEYGNFKYLYVIKK